MPDRTLGGNEPTALVLGVLAVWAATMSLVPIRAWEPTWLVGLSSALIVILLPIGRQLNQRLFGATSPTDAQSTRPKYRFSLADMLPSALDKLAPRYLATAPVDPLGEHLRFRREGEGFVLYSVGWDRKDDGGRFGTRTEYWASNPSNSRPQSRTPEGVRPGSDFDLETLRRQRFPEEPAVLGSAGDPPEAPPHHSPEASTQC